MATRGKKRDKKNIQSGIAHISSTVNTLFLAYAGAALPLLLLFTEADQSVGSVITREIVATEVVRTLVGSVGLVLLMVGSVSVGNVGRVEASHRSELPVHTHCPAKVSLKQIAALSFP